MNINRFGVTPIQKISNNLNINNIYIKRDDLFPVSFGGNKARKAILFFKDLKNKVCDCVVTYGSNSSNHCRVVANIAASEGLPCYIISPSEAIKITFNSRMINLFGAEVIQCSVSEVSVTIDKKMQELKGKGNRPYFINGGGHGNIGTQAYVDTYQEILYYEKSMNIYFDYIFHASGTGTTQAGLVCGKIVNNDDRRIVGISIARRNPYGKQVVLDSVNSYLKSIEKDKVNMEKIDFIDDYVLDGYSHYNKEILETIKKMLIKDGIPLDTTYTGKAFWGMKEYIKKNQIKGENMLFIHTGGTPLFFDDLGELVSERRY